MLNVTLSDGRTFLVEVPDGDAGADELQSFIRREGAFARYGDWLPTRGGEWVKYDCVVSVREAPSPGRA